VILTRQRRAPVAVALSVVGVLLLSGCGSSVGVHPGAAAVVGGETLSMNKIDDTTLLYCKAYVASSQQSQQGQSGPEPMGLFRSFVASGLAKRALGSELADAYSVEPASGYQSQVSQIQQALASAPADERQAVVDVAASDAYLQNVQVSIGQKLTGNEGTAQADVKANLQRGQVATQDWLKDHDIFVDPVFGLTVDGGQFTRQQDQTSYARSSLARGGVAAFGQQGPPSSYTAALPAAQICQ
jgi:hypothetical protein